MNKKDLIRQYYHCYRTKDLELLRSMLTKEFQFISAYAQYTDRDVMLEEIWPHVLTNNNFAEGIEIYENGDQFMVKYFLKVTGKTSMVEYIAFEGDKISCIEVFIGNATRD